MVQPIRIQLTFLGIFLLTLLPAFSQGGPGLGGGELPNLDRLPPSPEASAFAKYGEYPVDMSTGVPGISIPLLSLGGRELSASVGLSYHASGIKVAEIPSSVGSGWTLSGGGSVTRVVRGLPDEIENGFLSHVLPDPGVLFLNETEEEIRLYANGEKDSQPDLFYYSMGGMSGQFVFDGNGRAHTIPYSPIKIYFDGSQQFHITDASGVTYIFGGVSNGMNAVEQTRATGQGQAIPAYISSWKLTEMISPNGTDVIKFNYEFLAYTGSQYSFVESKVIDPAGPQGNEVYSFDDVYTKTSVVSTLSSIESSTGKIVFTNIGPSGRLDGGSHRVDKIELFNLNSQLEKGFVFSYDYFDGTASNANEKRLRLLSVQEFDKNSSLLSTNPFEFEYYDSAPYSLPARDSKSIDHWGYYNGSSNTTFIPTTTVGTHTYTGANRDPSFSHGLSYTIKKIEYPTGGETEFVFEQNQYYSSSSSQAESAGGLRIQKIHSREEASSTVTLTKEYVYLTDGAICSGKLVSPLPVYLTLMTQIEQLSNQSWVMKDRVRLSSSNVISVTGASGNSVLYTKVTEFTGSSGSQGDNGKSEFYFDYAYDGTPFQSQSWERGHLLTQRVSKKVGTTYKPVSETINTYNYNAFPNLAVDVDAFTMKYKAIEGNANFPIGLFSVWDIFEYDQDKVESRAVLLTSTVQKTYDDDGITFSQVSTDFTYGNELHSQVTEQKITNSDGAEYITEYTYPLDYFGNYASLQTCYTNYENAVEGADAIRKICSIDRYKTCGAHLSGCLESYTDCFAENNAKCMTYCGVPCDEISTTENNCIGGKTDYLTAFGNHKIYWSFSIIKGLMIPFAVENCTMGGCDPQVSLDYKACLTSHACESDWNTTVNTASTDLNSCLSSFFAQFSSSGLSTEEEALVEMLPHNKHMLNTVIEHRTWVLEGAVKKLVSAQKSTFQLLDGLKVVPDEVYLSEASSPPTEASFVANPSSYYQRRVQFLEYDPHLNPLSYRKENDIPTRLTWGKNAMRPTAQVVNSLSDESAYTGFETQIPTVWDQGGWDVDANPQVKTRSSGIQETGPDDLISTYNSQQAIIRINISNLPSDNTLGIYGELTFEKVVSGVNEVELVVPILSGSNPYQEHFLDPGTYSVSLSCAEMDGSPCPTNGEIQLTYSWDENDAFYEGYNHTHEAKTGIYAYQLKTVNGVSNQLEKEGMPAGDYILSYWQRLGSVTVSATGGGSVISTEVLDTDANGWELVEKNISISATTDKVTVSGSNILIDDVRLFPKQAQVQSFCYDDALRVTTQTDMNNFSIRYEYDDLGRLRLIRDQNGNIVKKVSYSYTDQ